MRIRKKIVVNYTSCTISYEKREDTIKNWSGLCKLCSDLNKIETKIKGKKINPDRFCEDCNSQLYTYNLTNKCKNCWGKSNKGDAHYNWKGGNSKGYRLGYYSKEYKDWRKKVFERDNYTCQECQFKGYLTAHHIKSFAYFPELRFELNNGLTLCEECHKKTDNYKGKAVKHNKKLKENEL